MSFLTRPVLLQQPARLAFGDGVALDAADELVRRGLKSALLVTSPRTAPLAQPLIGALTAKGVAVRIVSDVPPEPTVAAFESILKRERTQPVDSVLALGGGSVIDVAKLLAALLPEPRPVKEFFGISLLPPRKIYLACLPTTAGTGAEVSPNAILLDEAEQLKKGVVSPWLVPDAAFVDPLLTVSLPADITAATGLDALTHCIEAYANKFAHPAVDLYALEGIRLISRHLLRAVKNGSDLEARRALALGSMYGGLCLGPVNTAAVHALAYPLGGEFRLSHGLSNALLLPHVLFFNLPAAPARYAAIAVALGATAGSDDTVTAARGIDFLSKLSVECGLPRGLSACGVPASAVPRMAVGAMKVTRLLKNNLRELTVADAEQIYTAAL